MKMTASMVLDYGLCWLIEKGLKTMFSDFRPRDIAERRPEQLEREAVRKEKVAAEKAKEEEKKAEEKVKEFERKVEERRKALEDWRAGRTKN